MERRTALAYAAATAGTVLAGGTAFAATAGVLTDDTPSKQPVEQISSTDDSPSTTSTTLAEPTVMTIIVDDPALAPVDDNGGDRPDGVSDDAPDLFDDNGGDRPAGVSDDALDDDSYDHDELEDDDHDSDHDSDDDDGHGEDESDDDHGDDDD